MNHKFLFIVFTLMVLNFFGISPVKAEGVVLKPLPTGPSNADISGSNTTITPELSPASDFANTIFGSPSSGSSVNSTQDPVDQPPQERSSILPNWAVKILKDNGIDIDNE